MLAEMESAGAEKEAELTNLVGQNEALAQERAAMEEVMVTVQQQAERTTLELSASAQENSLLRQEAEGMADELQRLQTERIVQQEELRKHQEDRSGMEEEVARHSEEKQSLQSTVQEDSMTKRSVQQIIYDIERESQAQIQQLHEANGRKEAQIVKLRAELEDAQMLRVGRWKCASCTFINVSANGACEMCNVPRSDGGAMAGGSGGGGGIPVAQPIARPGSAQHHGIVGLPGR